VVRFDRQVTASGWVARTHQEDFCQVLGLAPEIKYASHPVNPRLPSLARIASALARRAGDPAGQLIRLLEQATVSVAIGNTDAHAKNYSVFHRPGAGVELTPIYDVAPTHAFIDQRHAALPVAGKFVLADITQEDLVREATAWGVPERIARSTVARTIEAMLDEGIAAADGAHPQIEPRIRTAAIATIRRLAAS
jgi:serine/threonine-protein kinase HipA